VNGGVAGQQSAKVAIRDQLVTARNRRSLVERAEVARAVAEESGVVALGGGAPVDPGTRQVLAGQVVVFLDVGIADAARRVGFDRSRPLLAVNPRASWVRLMGERRPVYEAVATHRVDTAGRSAQDVAAEVAALLGPV
jgi:shikimate kinase